MLIKFFTFEELEVPDELRYLDNDDIAEWTRAAKNTYPDNVDVIPRGWSPGRNAIVEVVVEDHRRGPKQHIAIHTDPHPSDERVGVVTAIEYAKKLLRAQDKLKGRCLHLLFSSPDPRAMLKMLNRSAIDKVENPFSLRDSDVTRQAGWTLDPLGTQQFERSSPGYRAVDAMLRSILSQVETARDGSAFRLFESAHNAMIASGDYFLVGTHRSKFTQRVGRRVEGVTRFYWRNEFARIRNDNDHLSLVPGTVATVPPSTAEALRANFDNVRVAASDVELAHHLAAARNPFGVQLMTFVQETPEYTLYSLDRLRRLIEANDEVEIKKQIAAIKVKAKDAAEILRAVGEKAARRPIRDDGLKGQLLDVLVSLNSPLRDSWGTGWRDGVTPSAGTPPDDLLRTAECAYWDARGLWGAGHIIRVLNAPVAFSEEWMMLMTKCFAKMQEIMDVVESLYEVEPAPLEEHVGRRMTALEVAFASSMGRELPPVDAGRSL